MAAPGLNHLKNLSLGRCGYSTGVNTQFQNNQTSLADCAGGVEDDIKLSQFSFSKVDSSLDGDDTMSAFDTEDYEIDIISVSNQRWTSRIGRLDNPNKLFMFAYDIQREQASSNMTATNRGAVVRVSSARTGIGTDGMQIAALMLSGTDISIDTNSFRSLVKSIDVLGNVP